MTLTKRLQQKAGLTLIKMLLLLFKTLLSEDWHDKHKSQT